MSDNLVNRLERCYLEICLREAALEASSGFARLRRVYSIGVWRFLTYADRLAPESRSRLLLACSKRGFVVRYPSYSVVLEEDESRLIAGWLESLSDARRPAWPFHSKADPRVKKGVLKAIVSALNTEFCRESRTSWIRRMGEIDFRLHIDQGGSSRVVEYAIDVGVGGSPAICDVSLCSMLGVADNRWQYATEEGIFDVAHFIREESSKFCSSLALCAG